MSGLFAGTLQDLGFPDYEARAQGVVEDVLETQQRRSELKAGMKGGSGK